jgi:hypothetical protein
MALTDQDIVSQFQLVTKALDAHRQALQSVVEQLGSMESMVRENVQPETKMLVVLNGILLGVLRSKNVLTADEAVHVGTLAQTLMGPEYADRTEAVAGLIDAACRAVVGEGPREESPPEDQKPEDRKPGDSQPE